MGGSGGGAASTSAPSSAVDLIGSSPTAAAVMGMAGVSARYAHMVAPPSSVARSFGALPEVSLAPDPTAERTTVVEPLLNDAGEMPLPVETMVPSSPN